MAERDLNGPITLSLLDRLLDEEPKSRAEVPLNFSKSLAKLKLGLQRDLENLLNSRRNPVELPESCVETAKSVYMYGFPDISSVSSNFFYDEGLLLAVIEQTLATFEPRLYDIQVSLLPPSGTTRVLRFVIEAMLRIDPTPEHVVYDAALELTSGEYQVTGATRA